MSRGYVYREGLKDEYCSTAPAQMKRLYVELTSRCPGGCVACVRRSWDEAQGDLPLDLFREVIGQARAV